MAAAHRHDEHAGYATPEFARDATAWSARMREARDARAVRADAAWEGAGWGGSGDGRGYFTATGGGRLVEDFEEFGRMAEAGAGYGGGAESDWPAAGFDTSGPGGFGTFAGAADPAWSEAESDWPAANFDWRGQADPTWSGGALSTPGLADTGNLTATGDLTWSEPEIPVTAANRPFVPPTPRRTTSHRRPTPRRHVSLRATAIMALGAGLVITAPLVLRSHHGHDLALTSPDPDTTSSSASEGVPPTATATSSTPTSPAVGAASTGDRPSATPTSRRTTHPPTSAPSAKASQPSQSSPPQQTVPTVQLTPEQAAAFEDQVVALTNAQRVANGCVALRSDPRLQAAAIGHSVDMRARDYFGHDTPDGVTPWTRIEAQGYSDPSAENIAMGQRTPQAVVDAWMNSPGHRANILNCSSKAIGVGVQFGPNGPWWTQDFGYS